MRSDPPVSDRMGAADAELSCEWQTHSQENAHVVTCDEPQSEARWQGHAGACEPHGIAGVVAAIAVKTTSIATRMAIILLIPLAEWAIQEPETMPCTSGSYAFWQLRDSVIRRRIARAREPGLFVLPRRSERREDEAIDLRAFGLPLVRVIGEEPAEIRPIAT